MRARQTPRRTVVPPLLGRLNDPRTSNTRRPRNRPFDLGCATAPHHHESMTPLTPAVVQKIEVLFPPESREAAGRMIAERCGTDLPLSTHMGRDPSGFDRIRFAVL